MRYYIGMKNELNIIAHNIRSAHNVGALLRTADGLGINHIYFTGYTPYPKHDNDSRLPHLSDKIEKQINKTALGAQKSVQWSYEEDIITVLADLKSNDFLLAGLEQTEYSFSLPGFKTPEKLAILLGSEVTGIDSEILKLMDMCLEIPMVGKKESYNVVEAATMAMYQCKLAY